MNPGLNFMLLPAGPGPAWCSGLACLSGHVHLSGLFSELIPVALQSSHGVWEREQLLCFYHPWNFVDYESFEKNKQKTTQQQHHHKNNKNKQNTTQQNKHKTCLCMQFSESSRLLGHCCPLPSQICSLCLLRLLGLNQNWVLQFLVYGV